jgi:CheY-like chemotaxis protein
VILFEMLAGRRPFSADDPHAVIDLILHDSPEGAVLGPDVSQRLAMVIDKALTKDPEGRFENGTALAHALSACKRVVSAWAAMRGLLTARRRHRPVTALALLLALGVFGWGGWRMFAGSRDAGLSVTHVLWADDNPENNASVMLRLRESGVLVTTTLSTAETLERYDPLLHQLVVSDVGRFEGENGEYVGRAGLDLLARLKERHQTVQLLFCTSHRAAAEYREEALAAGALGIVTNCEEVLALIGL